MKKLIIHLSIVIEKDTADADLGTKSTIKDKVRICSFTFVFSPDKFLIFENTYKINVNKCKINKYKI